MKEAVYKGNCMYCDAGIKITYSGDRLKRDKIVSSLNVRCPECKVDFITLALSVKSKLMLKYYGIGENKEKKG